MLNDILTGQASNADAAATATASTPGAAAPGAASGTGQVPRSCTRCGATYLANAGAWAGPCGPCELAIARDPMVGGVSRASLERTARGERRARWLWGAGLSALLLVTKVAAGELAEDSYEQEDQTSSLYFMHDAYSSQLDSFASEVCACTELACARDVAARFRAWQRSTTDRPGSAEAQDAADQALDRYATCYGQIEVAAGAPSSNR